GEADAGIARRAFDDETAGLDDLATLGVEHDVLRRAVLHGSARVQEFGLAEDRAAGELRRLAQLDQRRVADRVDEILTNARCEIRCMIPAVAPHVVPSSADPFGRQFPRQRRLKEPAYCTLRPPRARLASRCTPRLARPDSMTSPSSAAVTTASSVPRISRARICALPCSRSIRTSAARP